MSISDSSCSNLSFFQKKLKYFLAVSIVLILCISGTYFYHLYFCPDTQFEKICEDLSNEFFSSDALSLAFTFSDPPQTEMLLPVYHKEEYVKSSQNDYLSALKQINCDRLSDKNSELYDILLDYFNRHEADDKFLYLEQPLTPTGGVQTNLPVLLAEYPIKDKADIEQYFDILETIPEYLESLGAYEKDRKEAGYIMPTDDINEVIAQCDKMCSDDGYTLFTEGFANLLANANLSLSSSETELYKAECDRIVTTMIFPAYEALGDTLLLLREENVPRKGLFHYGQRNYYAHLLAQKTGSDKSVKEIEKMLQKRFQVLADDFNNLLILARANPPSSDFEIVSGEPEELLLYLEDTLQQLFPALPYKVSSTIHDVPDCLLPYTAPAYYFTPQVDNYLENCIYLNRSDITDKLSLLTTLAHEGYPGHMLQSTYFLAHEQSDDAKYSSVSPTQRTALRNALNYIGYVEGWAMYVELLSYDYAIGKDADQDNMLQNYCRLLRTDKELKICLYCLLDIRIHYYGDTIENITPYLCNIGIKDRASIEAVFNYLTNEPATYASYYVGFLELSECKKIYQAYCDAMDIAYSDKAFHQFYLECGPCSFSHIKNKLSY